MKPLTITACLLVWLSISTPLFSQVEIIKNGDFSKGTESWNFSKTGAENDGFEGVFTVVPDGGPGGKPAAVLAVANASADAAGWRAYISQFPFPIYKDRTYILSCDVKGKMNVQNGKWPYVCVGNSHGSWGDIKGCSSLYLNIKDTWEHRSLEFTPQEDCDAAYLRFRNFNFTGAELCIANVSLKEKK